MYRIRVEISALASTHRSGVAQYTQLLVDALAKSNSVKLYTHHFNFLKRQPEPQTQAPEHNSYSNIYIPLRAYAKAQSHSIAPVFDMGLPKVDLTIFTNFANWPTVKSRLVASVIHDLTYVYFPEVVEKNNLPHLRRIVPKSIKKSDFIITVSESVKAELIKEFGIEESRCIVTPIPPDESFFKKASNSQIKDVKKKYGLSLEKEYIYFIGNLEPRKNLNTLVRAYQILPDEIKSRYQLVMAGGKGWKTEESELAIQSAIASGDDVLHIGFVDQKDSSALLQGASLFVMPSLYEGFGMPILEAMASGCNVVASDIPVLREVGSIYATYADPHDPRSFASAIKESLDKKIKRSLLEKNVRRYSWKKNVETITKKCDQLLERL